MSGRGLGLALLLCAGGAAPAAGQGIRRESGFQGLALLGDRDAYGAGIFVAVRPGGRARLSLFAGGGREAGRRFVRGELLSHFLLAPDQRRGVAPYVAGGLAVQSAEQTDVRIVALLGLEGGPGARQGWVLEGGIGGGWRVAAGWRWRR